MITRKVKTKCPRSLPTATPHACAHPTPDRKTDPSVSGNFLTSRFKPRHFKSWMLLPLLHFR